MNYLKLLHVWRSTPTLAKANAANALYKPDKKPVAIFFGGTSGIGRAMAEQLAKQTNGRAHIIILGRNQTAAEEIIASFPRTDPSAPPEDASEYSFVKVDATSMTQVREVAAQLKAQLPKINFIITSTGVTDIKGREETADGIDRKMSGYFYARFRFIHDLAPLVEKAAEDGEHVAIASIFAAGRGVAVDLNDLGLVKGYGLVAMRRHSATYTDCVMQDFASKYPKVPFYHEFPGIVKTPMLINSPTSKYFVPLMSPFIFSPPEAAEMMWWRLWDPEARWRTGAHQVDHLGEELTNPNVTPQVKEAVWKHAMEMTGPK
ncbi:NAD(P)-binding protein [Serendipita vermifera]|nr:NAD(P)-binding protein [Serendipita vermifera]